MTRTAARFGAEPTATAGAWLWPERGTSVSKDLAGQRRVLGGAITCSPVWSNVTAGVSAGQAPVGRITFHMPRGQEQELALNRYLDAESIFVSVQYTPASRRPCLPHYFTDLDDRQTLSNSTVPDEGSPMV